MRYRLLLCTVLCTLPAGLAHAQNLPGVSSTLHAQLRQLSENHLRLVENVELTGSYNGEDWQFHADVVDFYIDESRLVASGNVVFSSEGGRIAAERVEFNTEDLTGVFYAADGSTAVVAAVAVLVNAIEDNVPC